MVTRRSPTNIRKPLECLRIGLGYVRLKGEDDVSEASGPGGKKVEELEPMRCDAIWERGE